MSDQQRPDEQSSSGHYERADASKFPTSEVGQRAAVEGMAAAEGWTGPGLSKAVREHNRRAAARSGLEIDRPRADVLRDKMLAIFAEMEEATELRRANQEAAHGLRELADRYADAESHEERDAIAEQAGASLTLAEAGLIRRVAKAMERALPEMIVAAHVGDGEDAPGMAAPEIARELGCTSRHAYQVIRDNPWEARWVLYRATGDAQWEPVHSGTVQTTDTAAELAYHILAERVGDDVALARTDVRVCVWWTADELDDEPDPDEARATDYREGDTPLNH